MPAAAGHAAASGGRLGLLAGLDRVPQDGTLVLIGRAAAGELDEQPADRRRVGHLGGQPGKIGFGTDQPTLGGNSSTSVCGHFSRSRSIGDAGRTVSVSTTLTQAAARPARSPSALASRSAIFPRTSRSGRSTGAASWLVVACPAASMSATVTDLAWFRSENENASGDPEYRTVVPAAPAGVFCWPCKWPRAT